MHKKANTHAQKFFSGNASCLPLCVLAISLLVLIFWLVAEIWHKSGLVKSFFSYWGVASVFVGNTLMFDCVRMFSDLYKMS
jgi:hypothetical protein